MPLTSTSEWRFYLLASVILLFIPAFLASSSGQPVEIRVLSPSEGSVVRGTVEITGEVIQHDSVYFDAIEILIGESWHTAEDTSSEGNWGTWRYEWHTGIVENGHTVLVIGAKDGFDHYYNTTLNVTVNNIPPTCEIVNVTPESVREDVPVYFEGRHLTIGTASEIDQYRWESSIDGILSRASSFSAYLSPGHHTIYFRVRNDAYSWSDADTVDITVLPLNGTTMVYGTPGGASYLVNACDEDALKEYLPGWYFLTGDYDWLGNHCSGTGSTVIALISTEDTVFASTRDGWVYALDLNGTDDGVDGTHYGSADLLWSYNLTDIGEGFGHEVRLTPSMTYYDGILLLGTLDGFIYALDVGHDATPYWLFPFSVGDVLDPADNMMCVLNGRLYIATNTDTGGRLLVVDIEERRLLASLLLDDVPSSRPIAAGKWIYVPARNKVYLVTYEEGRLSAEVLEFPNSVYVSGVSAHSGHLVITTLQGKVYLYDYALNLMNDHDTHLAFFYPAAVSEDRIVVIGQYKGAPPQEESEYKGEYGYILIFDSDLNLLKTFELDSNGTPSAPPTIAGDKAFASTSRGTIYAFDLEELDLLWTLNFSDYSMTDVNQSYLATSPLVVTGSRLFFGSHDTAIYAIGDFSQAPLAFIDEIIPEKIYHGQSIRFSGHGHSLVGRDIVEYLWNISINDTEAKPHSTSASFQEVLPEGNHTVNFTVMDEGNRWAVPVSVKIQVLENSKPVIRIRFPRTVYVNKAVTFDLSESYDPDGDDIRFHIDFGDGYTSTFSGPIITHLYTRPGTYEVTVRIYDQHDVEGKPYYLKMAIKEEGVERTTFPLICLVPIIAVIIIIVASVGLYIKLRREEEGASVEEALEGVEEEKEVRGEEFPKVEVSPMPPPALSTEEISLEELERRLEALVEQKKELDRLRKGMRFEDMKPLEGKIEKE